MSGDHYLPANPAGQSGEQTVHRSSHNNKRAAGTEIPTVWTPEDYARNILAYSRSTGLFHGEEYYTLGRFLNRQFDSTSRSARLPEPDPRNWRGPVLYRWADGAPSSRFVLQSIDDLAQIDPHHVKEHNGAMLILAGYQSPQWLNGVGARARVDPAVFHEHLDFRDAYGKRMLYATPLLPSANEGLVRLRYFTIGICENGASSRDTSAIRKRANDGMDQYLASLYEEHQTLPGDTIVRGFHVHSPKIFSMEQQITIGIRRASGGGWTGVTWIDSGNDRKDGLAGPWHHAGATTARWGLNFLPNVMRSPRIALDWQHRGTVVDEPGEYATCRRILQVNYGTSLNAQIMASEPFYAITEFMQFAASSINQHLNMLEGVISRATLAATIMENNHDISDLSYHQQLLDEVARTLRENLRIIEQRGSPSWPKAKDPKHRAKADRTAASVLADYKELLHRNQALVKRCHSHMKTIMNQASIAETQRVTQLTWLAFMFVPLTFSTSFLGMNLRVFGQGTAPLWLWFAITAPLMLAAVVLLCWSHGMPSGVRVLIRARRASSGNALSWSGTV